MCPAFKIYFKHCLPAARNKRLPGLNSRHVPLGELFSRAVSLQWKPPISQVADEFDLNVKSFFFTKMCHRRWSVFKNVSRLSQYIKLNKLHSINKHTVTKHTKHNCIVWVNIESFPDTTCLHWYTLYFILYTFLLTHLLLWLWSQSTHWQFWKHYRSLAWSLTASSCNCFSMPHRVQSAAGSIFVRLEYLFLTQKLWLSWTKMVLMIPCSVPVAHFHAKAHRDLPEPQPRWNTWEFRWGSHQLAQLLRFKQSPHFLLKTASLRPHTLLCRHTPDAWQEWY